MAAVGRGTVMFTLGVSWRWLEEAGIEPGAVRGGQFRTVDLDDRARLTDPALLDGLVLTDDLDPWEIFGNYPNLRLLAVPGSGVWDQVDVAEATRRRIAVSNLVDYATPSVAELTIGLLLAVARGIHLPGGSGDGVQLAGRRLLVVGLGAIGRRVAELADGLGMEVLAAVRRPPPTGKPPHVGMVGRIDDLLVHADAVSLHAPFRPGDRPILDEPRLRRLPTGALIVNTARGGLIDHEALRRALDRGHLRAAALDVTDPEPLPPAHPLRLRADVLITDHIGARTREALARAAKETLAIVGDFAEGRPRNLVNKSDLVEEFMGDD